MLTYKPIKNLRIHRLTTTVSLLCGVFFLPTTAAAETAWERSNATSESYDFAVNDGSGNTQYYNINLKDIDNISWTSGTADPSWNEGTSTATGSISFEIPHVIGDSPVKDYIYQYTLPTGYTETETRYANESGSGDEEATLAVNNKLFFNIEEAGQGGAVFLKSTSAHTYTDTIQSDFINNSTIHKYGGGAVAISGKTKITSVIGNFIGNVAYKENAGALNLGTDQTINEIRGNFIGNRSEGLWQVDAPSKPTDGGGAIYTKQGNRNYITGDFIGNSALRKAGAIYHNSATIGTITSDFIANTAGEDGGAIYTYTNTNSKINNIIGDFINNKAGGSGGAIYVGSNATYGSIRGSFLGNIAGGKGGAIYNRGTISIDATSDDGDIVFYNNKAGENYSDIFNDGGTISLNAAEGQKISFGGRLYSSGTININNKTGIQGGTYVFNNDILNSNVNLYNGAKLILGKITQTNGDITYGNFNQIALLTTDNNSGEINQINDHIDSNTINTVELGSNGLIYKIDVDATEKTADKITTTAESHGTITIGNINIIGNYEDLSTEDVIQIISNGNADSTLKLQLASGLDSEHLLETIEGSTTDEAIATTTAWDKIYQTTVISDKEIYGQLGLKTKTTTDDSIGITVTRTEGGDTSYENMGDTLKLVNQDTINTTKNFTANQQGATYNLSDDLGATNGTVNINGVSGGNAETLNLASHQGFQVGDDATALNFNDVTVNSSSAIATVTNGSATIGVTNSILNGNIAASTAAYGLTLSGNNTINGTVGMANATMNDSNGGLIFNTDTFTNANTVNFTAGSINLGNTSSYDTYAINHLNSNANVNYTIDFDASGKQADVISATNNSAGTITLSHLNLTGDFTGVDANYKVQIINNASGSALQLALSDAVISQLGGSDIHKLFETTQTVTGSDQITATTNWNDQLSSWHREDTIEHYGTIGLTTTTTTNDSIGYIQDHETTVQGDRVDDGPLGDTLKLVNQDTINTTKNFTANQQGATYNLSDDLGATNGTVNINGVSGGNAETLNLASHQGFQVGDDATALNFNDVTVNSSSAIATVTNGSATIGVTNSILNGTITGDTAFNMTTSGTSQLNGAVTNANITNTGNLTTTAANIADSSITNSSNLYLSGVLAKTIAGTGTTYVNSTLTLNSGAEVAGTLNANSGTITVSNGTITSHDIGAINGNGNLAIDMNLSSSSVDTFNLTNASSGTLTLTSVNILDPSTTSLADDFSVQVLNPATSSTLKLALSSAVQAAFNSTEYIIGTSGATTSTDTIEANTAWNKVYQEHTTTASTDYGKLGLSDDKLSIEVAFSRRDGGTTTDTSLGDTLKLVNNDTTNATKNFTANQQGKTYNVGDDLGDTKGTLNIKGISGGAAETLNLNGHGFQLGEGATALNFDNVTVSGASTIANVTNGSATVGIKDSIINGTITGATAFNMTTSGTNQLNGSVTNANITNTGNLTTKNSTIGNSVVNNGTINLVNTIVNGDITNNGTLNLKTGTALTNAISSTNNNGVINVNNNWTLSNTISGNKINVNNSTLKVGSNYLDNTDTINAKNSKIDIGANTVNLKSMKLDSSSTLSLKINGLEDGQHGLLNITDDMTINSGAKLKATLAQGINYGEVTLIKAGSHNGDFADKDVSHTEEGVDVAENNMYKFIKTKGKFGVFSILQKSTAADVAKEQGARSWVANAAGAWVDEAPFAEGSSGAIAADKLAALAQHDAAGFVHNLKALAPTETAVVQNTVTEQNSILFKTVDSYLRNKQIGLLSSDEFSDVTAWGNPYLSDTKMRTRQNIDGSNSNSRGIIFGLEKELDRAYKFGAGLQIDRTDVDIMSRDIDINSVTGFVYGEYKPCRQFINGIISYGQSNYKEKKYALDDTYNARYDVWVASVASMAGYQFEYFTPEAGFRYYHIKRDRYTDSAAQKVSADNADILRGVISLRFAREIYDIRAEAYLGLTYDFMADKNNTHVYLSNGSGYVVDGDKLRRLGYETSLSFAKSLTENISAAVSYMGTYRSGYQEHTGMLSLRYAFE